MKFLENFKGGVFQIFRDNPNSTGYAGVLTSYDEKQFRELNEKGCGIYFTPNAFSATEEERDKLWEELKLKDPEAKRPTARKKEFLRKINAVYGDLDVAKEGEDVSTSEMIERKKVIMKALLTDKIVPNFIIDTKNGVQPIWLVDENNVDADTCKKAVNVMEGIIQWSTKYGCKGDKVKDLTRVLRLPNYNHVKGEPYAVKARKYSDESWTIDLLTGAFPYTQKEEVKAVVNSEYKKNDVSLAIDGIDFQELMKRAFASTGRQASFDGQKRLILDGRLTGTHQGKVGGGDFMASSSHEPFEGNRITATADILGVTNKEARKWIVEEYSLKGLVDSKKVVEAKKVAEEVVLTDEDRDIEELMNEINNQGPMFTWGTKGLDRNITPIELGHFIILAGLTNAGKTAFAFDMAYKNAVQGKKVLFLSLEMSRKQIYKRVARSYANISKSQWRDKSEISEEQKKMYEQKLTSMNDTKNMILLGFRHDQSPTVKAIFEVIDKINPDITIVDNFDLVAKDSDVLEYVEQNRIAGEFMAMCHDKKRSVIMIHHKNSKTGKQGIAGNRGSGKIGDDCDMALNCSREWAKDSFAKDNARFVVVHDKDRDFGQYDFAEVFFQDGTFVDEFRESKPVPNWQDNI